MLRFRDIRSASAAGAYYGKSDGGYYLDSSDLRREVGGKAADRLGLSNQPDFEQFQRLLQGLNPHTGEQLTAKLIDGRLAGWDVTASIPKGVTIALEQGDARIHEALWEAGRETMADLEAMMTTRKRKGGEQDNRTTGNMIWYGFEHPETRPARSDGMPDPDRHIHFVIPNVTYDSEEQQWKAIKFRPIMDLRKWFDRRFDLRLAGKLTDLGYGIETKYKTDDRGDRKFFSWDIQGMPPSVVAKFSRRTGEVEQLAETLGIENPQSKDKLGATSRLHKRDDMTLADYRKYWQSRITPTEDRKLKEVIQAASLGKNASPQNSADKGMAYAISHHFERRSVLPLVELEITAMERSMGGATPEEVQAQAKRQGVLVKDALATTRDVLAEETRIIDFAREGRGVWSPMASGLPSDVALSQEQAAMVNHVLQSPDQIVLVIGDAGTGKTRSIKAAFQEIDRPIEMLAPSANASRGVLREEGFHKADTVASFLLSEQRQEAVKNGVIWIDEAGLLPIKDLSALTEIAREQNARLVLQGDPKQHKSVVRHGNMMNVLQEYAGLPVGRLTEIWRQKEKGYKAVVADIAKGDILGGYDKLNALGWVQHVENHQPIVDDYLAALDAGKSVLIVAPTHLEGMEITGALRQALKERGVVSQDEHVFETLKNVSWTEAQKGDREQYDGSEVLQFHRNSGPYRAGQRVSGRAYLSGTAVGSTAHFSVYSRNVIGLAVGDALRISNNGKDKSGKHRLDNGAVYRVDGFTKEGDIALNNGWIVDKHFGHFTHGYVNTSHAAQGKTVDRVLIAMGRDSLGAVNAEQFYVSASRGRDSARIYTDMDPSLLRAAIQRSDPRQSATELMGRSVRKPRKRFAEKARELVKIIRDRYRALRDKAENAIERKQERELQHAR